MPVAQRTSDVPFVEAKNLLRRHTQWSHAHDKQVVMHEREVIGPMVDARIE